MRSSFLFTVGFALTALLSAAPGCRFDSAGISTGPGGEDARVDGGIDGRVDGSAEGGLPDAEGGVPPVCGDGVQDPGEECDDGPDNSDFFADACRTDCMLPTCGDGVQDTGEECDYGELNDDMTPDMCRTNCISPYCGDGVRDNLEACDNGQENSDTTPGACSTQCELPTCGDSVLDPGEECDDGPNNSDSAPDACRENCLLPGCGDGVLDTGEACDDGNVDEGDGCSSTCVVFPQPIDDNAWQCFEEDFNSCEDPCLPVVCSCSEDDSMNTCNGAETGGCVDAACVHLHSGGSGYCGLGGVHQTVTVPDAPGVILYAQVHTECDSHAGDALLIVNDGAQRHTLVAYHRVDVNWEEVTIDMTPWAGQTVRLEVAIQDTNDRWCDASDRSIRFKVDLLEFRQQ